MHHMIPKLLGMHVHQDEVACMFTGMRLHVAPETQACTSNVKVTLSGQMSKWEMLYRTVPYPTRISTMHQVTQYTCSWWGSVSRTRPRPESQCKVTLRGQRSKWVPLIGLYLMSSSHLNHASLDYQVTRHTSSPWRCDIWHTRHRPVPQRSMSHL